MRAEAIIGKLKERQYQAGMQLLHNPQGKEPFDYGAACGITKGIQIALDTIDELLAEEAKEGKANG